MKLKRWISALIVLLLTSLGLFTHTATAQETDSYSVGEPVGIMADGEFQPISSDVSVFGAIQSAESCIVDAD